MKQSDTISPSECKTLYEILVARARQSPRRVAYRYFDAHSKSWSALTWQDILKRVAFWRRWLSRYDAGERIVLALSNGPDWVACEQAALSLGLIVVPVATDERFARIEYFVRDSQASAVFIDREYKYPLTPETIPAIFSDIDVFTFDGSDPDGLSLVQSKASSQSRSSAAREAPSVSTFQSATLVYTSGTTGAPKGVLLSHRNIITVLQNVLALVDIHADDVFFSTQSLANISERVAVYYAAMLCGNVLVFPRSLSNEALFSGIRAFQPSVLISTPYFFDSALVVACENGFTARIKKKLLGVTKAKKHGVVAAAARWLLPYLVRPSLKRTLGNRLRVAIVGSAPINESTLGCYRQSGIPLIQGYGLTEASSVVTLDTYGVNGTTVGKPVGVEVKLSPANEILVRGESVMMGYWGNHQNKIDNDGWLYTGDIGYVENGYWYVLGRKENILVLANGQKFDIDAMRTAVLSDPLFRDVSFVGHESALLIALVKVDPMLWRGFCHQLRIPSDERNVYFHPRVKRALVTRVNVTLSKHLSGARVHEAKVDMGVTHSRERATDAQPMSESVTID